MTQENVQEAKSETKPGKNPQSRTPEECGFWTQLTTELLRCSQHHETGNVDHLRFGSQVPLGTAIGRKVLDFAASFGFHRILPIRYDVLETLSRIDGIDRAYRLFEDDTSRDLFVKLLAYRILGHRRVRLPLNNPKYWDLRQSLGSYTEQARTMEDIPILGSLDLHNIDGIRIHAHQGGVLNTFILEQYRCPRANVGVKRGDLTIDAGGCWGDTALYFAQKSAQVFCFECIPSNVAIINENLRLNPGLSANITVVQKALWSRSGEKFAFSDFGPGSRPSSEGPSVDVETQSIDDFVSANSVERVDFIKMDIEGSEPEALIGAERTIRKDRPQLAISLYHDVTHFAAIPNWLAALGLGYRFYLDHFTIHEEETVLFARCDR